LARDVSLTEQLPHRFGNRLLERVDRLKFCQFRVKHGLVPAIHVFNVPAGRRGCPAPADGRPEQMAGHDD
jgi:hypothetical protein